jgi:regulatory protein
MRIEFLSDRPDRAGRYTLRLDSGQTMRLYRQTVEDFALYTGMELEEGQLSALTQRAGEMSAKMRAVRIVAASSVSRRDLQQRLVRKGEDPDQAEAAVEWMEQLHLVDDRQTASEIVRRCISRGYGIARAKQMLYEKKIPKEYWEEALEDYPELDDKITEFLRSRLGPCPDEKQKRKAVDALLRRGHSYGAVRRALDALGQDTEEFQEE